MSKIVDEKIKDLISRGIDEKIRDIIKDMKYKGTITTNSELPEHYNKIAILSGLGDIDHMSSTVLRGFLELTDKILEDEFGYDVYAGYFVTESFKPITRKKFNTLLEKTINKMYEWGWEDDDDDDHIDIGNDSTDYASTYNRTVEKGPQKRPYVEENASRRVVVKSDDYTEKITGFLHPGTFSGGNTAYNGSVWTIRRYNAMNKVVYIQDARHKQNVIEYISSLPNFSKAKEELLKK